MDTELLLRALVNIVQKFLVTHVEKTRSMHFWRETMSSLAERPQNAITFLLEFCFYVERPQNRIISTPIGILFLWPLVDERIPYSPTHSTIFVGQCIVFGPEKVYSYISKSSFPHPTQPSDSL